MRHDFDSSSRLQEPEEDASFERQDAGEHAADAADDAVHEAPPKALKSGVSASEAARLRWAKQREREAAEAESATAPDDDHVLRCTVSVRAGKIMQALELKAAKGD